MTGPRPAAVAGTFYPRDAGALRSTVRALLAAADPPEPTGGGTKAIIAPHAGYIYSGPVAATAYRWLEPLRREIRRVVLVGPAHYRLFRGLALPRARGFATPLGVVPVDEDGARAASVLPQVATDEKAHAPEHCLEVHLPFLQEVLSGFAIVPLLVGEARTPDVVEVLELLWGGSETCFVISSDLSHHHDSATARRLDEATCRAIEGLRLEELDPDRACGSEAIRGLLAVARRRGLPVRTLDLRNSGDTAGPLDSVVGYGAWRIARAGET